MLGRPALGQEARHAGQFMEATLDAVEHGALAVDVLMPGEILIDWFTLAMTHGERITFHAAWTPK